MKPLIFLLLLSACSLNPLKALTGGPSLSANVQAGKENTQQAVAYQETTQAGRDAYQGSPVVAEQVKEVNIQQTPLWMIFLLILGWLLPSPNEIARWLRGLFKWTT